MRGYRIDDDDSYDIINIDTLELERTDETTVLIGYPDEGFARIWLTASGDEIVIPESS